MITLHKNEILTKVLECYTYNDQIYAILADTIFYPTSGGQNCDKGMIGNAEVLDVAYHNDVIVHQVSEAVSGEVKCVLDVNTRYKHSLLHSAQHLFSAVVESDKIITNSFAMKDNSFSIDVLKALSKDDLNDYENKINAAIRNGAQIIIRNYDKSLDSELDISYLNVDEASVRLVIIDGLDKNPCGGTHVDNISEIKYFKIVKWKYNNDSVRITALIGDDAINYANQCYDNFHQVVKVVNQPEDNVVEYIENKLKDYKKLQKELKKLKKQVGNV